MPKFSVISPAGQANPAVLRGSNRLPPPTLAACQALITAFQGANPQFASTQTGDNGMNSAGWYYFFQTNPACAAVPGMWSASLPNATMPTPAPGSTCAQLIAAFQAANPQFISNDVNDNGMTAQGWQIFFNANPTCLTDPNTWTAQIPQTASQWVSNPPNTSSPANTSSSTPATSSTGDSTALLFGAAVLGLIWWASSAPPSSRSRARN